MAESVKITPFVATRPALTTSRRGDGRFGKLLSQTLPTDSYQRFFDRSYF